MGGTWAKRGCCCRAGHLLALLAAITLTIAISSGGPARALAAAGATVAAPQLNLRVEPAMAAAVIGLLVQGEQVALLAGPTADGWYQVQSGEQTGWAFGGGLSLDDAFETAPTPEAAPLQEELQEETGLGGEQQGQPVEGASAAPVDVDSAEHWIDVNRTTQKVTLYEGDVAIADYWAAMGGDPSDDGFFATAVGTYYVYEKYGGLSWTDWGGAWVEDWVGFDPNRLNGFHTYSMDGTGQVIPGGDGPTGGCVALDPAAADQLFAFVSVGTRVEIHR